MEGYSAFLSTILSIGILTYAIGQWRAGRRQNKTDDINTANSTIDLLNKRATAIEKELDLAKTHIRESEINIAKLEEALKHKDATIDLYFKIITNRSPELEQTLKDVRNFLEALNKKINDGVKIEIKP